MKLVIAIPDRLTSTSFFDNDAEYTVVVKGTKAPTGIEPHAKSNGTSKVDLESYLSQLSDELGEDDALFATGIVGSSKDFGGLKSVSTRTVYFGIGDADEGMRCYDAETKVWKTGSGLLVCKTEDVN
mgnify:CR=1 FL=1